MASSFALRCMCLCRIIQYLISITSKLLDIVISLIITRSYYRCVELQLFSEDPLHRASIVYLPADSTRGCAFYQFREQTSHLPITSPLAETNKTTVLPSSASLPPFFSPTHSTALSFSTTSTINSGTIASYLTSRHTTRYSNISITVYSSILKSFLDCVSRQLLDLVFCNRVLDYSWQRYGCRYSLTMNVANSVARPLLPGSQNQQITVFAKIL